MGTMSALQSMHDHGPSPSETPANRRRFRRHAVLLTAKFHRGKTSVDCTIVDLSPTGAKLKLAQPISDKAVGTLENDRFGMIPGEVVWSSGEAVGIRFLDQPGWIAGLLSMVLPLTEFECTPTQHANAVCGRP